MWLSPIYVNPSLITVHPPLQRGLHTGCWGWSRCRTCSRTTCPCTTMTQRPEHSSPLSDPTKYQKSKRFQVSTYVHTRYPLFCCCTLFFMLIMLQHSDSQLIICLDCDRLVHFNWMNKGYWKRMSRISNLLMITYSINLDSTSSFPIYWHCPLCSTALYCTVLYVIRVHTVRYEWEQRRRAC